MTHAARFVVAAVILGVAMAGSVAQPPGKGKAPDVKKAEDKDDKGPPAGIPPADAKGYKLAQFIKAQIAKGATGEALAAAINKERKKLGLNDDDKDDEPATEKGKKKE